MQQGFGLKPVHGVPFYSFGGTSFWCVHQYSDIYKKNYLTIQKTSTYTKKDGESKESQSWVHLTIPAAEALCKILAHEIERAKNTDGVLYIFTYIV